jgi:hypothetical protein
MQGGAVECSPARLPCIGADWDPCMFASLVWPSPLQTPSCLAGTG